MPFFYRDADKLIGHPLAGSGTCVDLIKTYVPGLIGQPTTSWRQGQNVMEAGNRIAKGTAIAISEYGRYPRRQHDVHAALVGTGDGLRNLGG